MASDPTPTDPSPADVAARLREAATSIRNDGTPAQVGMTAEECDDAAALITSLQARAEKAERERDGWNAACMEARVGCNQRSATIKSLRRHLEAAEARATRAEEALKLIRICEADGERFRFFVHATADVALANKETENV